MLPLLRRVAFVVAFAAATTASAQSSSSLPSRLSDSAFWTLFATMSEGGGTFPSENFISNERTYQHPIPYLQSIVRPGDVYLGVGPEQNFTYIANLKPGFAVIFDIRRQNALAHLMYKALFELSSTRAEFVSRLFSRPLPDSVATKSGATAEDLFSAIAAASPNDSLFQRNLLAIYDRLTKTHGFALDSVDLRSIRHVYVTFFEAGTDINYNYRPGFAVAPVYPTLGELQALANVHGERMAFLADERRYEFVRTMELRNLIVPVVGDFAGPKAIRAVGAWLKEHKANVGAFYLSNVEQYLFRASADANHFYENVSTLPTDTTSMFIRSVPPQGSLLAMTLPPATPQVLYSVQVLDSGNVSTIIVTKDSAGQRITTRTVDSSLNRPRSPVPVFRALQPPSPLALSPRVTMGGTLFSGVAPIGQSLRAYRGGTLDSYSAAIGMTKVDGWK